MKKILFISFMFLGAISIAQVAADDADDNSLQLENELTANLLDLVIAGSFNVNYERLFEGNRSLHLSLTAFDTYGYYDAGYLEESNAFSFKAAFNIYFSKRKDHHGFYFYPAVKVRTGNITVEEYVFSSNGGSEQEYEYDIDGLGVGFGLGHKWLFTDRFSLSVNGEIFRAVGSIPADQYGDIGVVEPRFGVNFGYRF